MASAYIIPSAAPATRTVSRRLIRRDYAAICFDVPSFFSRSGKEEDEEERGEQKDDATAAADGGNLRFRKWPPLLQDMSWSDDDDN